LSIYLLPQIPFPFRFFSLLLSRHHHERALSQQPEQGGWVRSRRCGPEGEAAGWGSAHAGPGRVCLREIDVGATGEQLTAAMLVVARSGPASVPCMGPFACWRRAHRRSRAAAGRGSGSRTCAAQRGVDGGSAPTRPRWGRCMPK
jgi:hypothetical protein